MALSSGILALSIIGVLVAGMVTVVVVIAIYLCAKVAVQMYLGQDGCKGVERDASPSNGGNTVDEAQVRRVVVYSYGMRLFEMLGRRRNLELGLHGRESQEWYPRWVWHRFEAGDMDAVLARAMAAGDLGDMEKAARMCKVALWCVQYRPEDRPSMSNVIRMLEGEEQIATPGNPFAHTVLTDEDMNAA